MVLCLGISIRAAKDIPGYRGSTSNWNSLSGVGVSDAGSLKRSSFVVMPQVCIGN